MIDEQLYDTRVRRDGIDPGLTTGHAPLSMSKQQRRRVN